MQKLLKRQIDDSEAANDTGNATAYRDHVHILPFQLVHDSTDQVDFGQTFEKLIQASPIKQKPNKTLSMDSRNVGSALAAHDILAQSNPNHPSNKLLVEAFLHQLNQDTTQEAIMCLEEIIQMPHCSEYTTTEYQYCLGCKTNFLFTINYEHAEFCEGGYCNLCVGARQSSNTFRKESKIRLARLVEILSEYSTITRPIYNLQIKTQIPAYIQRKRFMLLGGYRIDNSQWDSISVDLEINSSEEFGKDATGGLNYYTKFNFQPTATKVSSLLWNQIIQWRSIDLQEWNEAAEGLTDYKASTLILHGGNDTFTGFHVDRSEAFNVAFPIGIYNLKIDPICATWYFVHLDKLEALDIAIMGLAPNKDMIRPRLNEKQFKKLCKDWNSEGTIFCYKLDQRGGDLVHVPAGWLHCVVNHIENVKVAWDRIQVENVPLYNSVARRLIDAGHSHMLIHDYVNHTTVIQTALVQRHAGF